MKTLAEFMIIAGADNCPPMLEKSMYDSWKSQDGTSRTKKYEELSVTKKLQADCDLKATNIVLECLPPDVYAIVNHHKVSKEIWDRVKLLMQGTKLSLQERKCKLYDKFSYVKDLGLAVLVFTQGDDTIACLNREMGFLSVVAASRRFTVQQVQRRQGQSYVGTGYKGNATSSSGNNAGGLVRVVKCYNCQGEGHMARQCTQPKRPRNAAWFKDKEMLAEAQEYGQILDEEQLAFLVDPCILDVLMANLSNYGSDVISKVPHSESYHNDMDNQKLSAEQAFWLQTSNPNIENFDISPVTIEVPSELPKNTSCDNQNALEILKYLENNDLKARLQAKDTTIRKLKEHIKSMKENDKEEKFKQDMDEIETINIELEHNLKGQIKEKVFVTKTLQNELRRLKGKNVLDDATTIAPGMFKLDLDPLAPRLLKNKDTHIDYLKYTQEQADIIQGIVEQAKSKQPLDNALDFSYKHAKQIQELLVYVQDTCLTANKHSEKLVVVTPMNKVKKVRWGLYGNVSGVSEVQELLWDDRATVHVEMGGRVCLGLLEQVELWPFGRNGPCGITLRI
nr:hypothetical protein [Tanacetum cinerariifolium]